MPYQEAVTIQNEMGLHVRPATAVAELARRYRAAIRIVKGAQRVDAKSCIELLTLAATKGTELVIEADGDDARTAVADLVKLIGSGFDEVV